MIIEEGSKVEIFINSEKMEEFVSNEEIEVDKEQLMFFTDGRTIITTDSIKPIEKIDNIYKIYGWLQDATAITKDGIYNSYMDMD